MSTPVVVEYKTVDIDKELFLILTKEVIKHVLFMRGQIPWFILVQYNLFNSFNKSRLFY